MSRWLSMQCVTAAISVAAVLFVAGASPALAQDHTGCSHALRAAKGRYMLCFGKAISKQMSPKLLLRCRERYAAAWSRAAERYDGTACDRARYQDNADGTVSDHLTGFTWEKKNAADLTADAANFHDVDNQYTLAADDEHPAGGTAYSEFLANLNTTAFAGQRDWRIPLLAEALTIVAPEQTPCSLSSCVADAALLPSPSSFMTSSASDRSGHNYLLVLDGGYVLDPFRTVLHWTRAVRGGF